MASKYFPFSPSVWNARLLDLGRDAALLYAYILSNNHRNSEGLFRLPKAYMAADVRFTMEELNVALKALQDEALIEYDHEAEVCYDPNALHFALLGSDKQVKGAINQLQRVPRTPLFARFFERAQAMAPRLAEEIAKQLPDRLTHSEQTPNGSQSDSPRTVSQGTDSKQFLRGTGYEVGVDDGAFEVQEPADMEAIRLWKKKLEAARLMGDDFEAGRIEYELQKLRGSA